MGMHRGAGFGWYDRPSLENTAILLWETGGCRVGGIRGVIASASLKLVDRSLGLDAAPRVSEALLPRPH